MPPMAPQKQDTASQNKSLSQSSRQWEALTPPLSSWILDAVSSMSFSRMTPVQASTIPLFVGNKDVVVEAVTGSGKTLAFLIPIVQRLLRLEEQLPKHHIGAIVISPTRELATQIYTVLRSLLAFHPASAAYLDQTSEDSPDDTSLSKPPLPAGAYSSAVLRVVPQLIVGGHTSPSQDLSHFLTQSPNLLISTPGRLLELLSSPHVHCPQSSFEVLVLDEADRLLDLGFKEDLQKILQRLPKQRRTGLFSASVSEAVDQLVRVGLRNPVRIAVKVKGKDGVEDRRTPASLQMTYLTTAPQLKLLHLLNLITRLVPAPTKSIAYLSTCAAVDYFSAILPSLLPLVQKTSHDLTIITLHGRQSATHRNKNLQKFTDSTTPCLLLTTDLASRGLDIPMVDLTIQLDPPSDPKTFLHRAGRAGRAGRKGLSIVFLTPGREAEDYPSFLGVRKTAVEPLETTLDSATSANLTSPSLTDAQACTSKIRQVVLQDRALHDKAQRAFVSFVRSYSKHAASSIFRVSDLDWPALADAWGLLRLPKMPELKNPTNQTSSSSCSSTDPPQTDRSLGLSINWSTYRYKDKNQEAKRQRQLDQEKETQTQSQEQKRFKNQKANPEKSEAWSRNTHSKEVAAARREKKAAKREAVRKARMSAEDAARETQLEGMIEEVRRRHLGLDALV